MDTVQEKIKILVVDDDTFLLKLYEKQGETSGVDLCSAVSGQAALEVLGAGFVPDVMAIDVTMAGMSGIDLLKEIREKKLAPLAKIVMLSNTTEDSTVKDAQELGAHKFIVKASLLPSQVLEELLKVAKE